MKRILSEASGSLVSGWLIQAIKQSNNFAIASDISDECVGKYLGDDYMRVPRCGDNNLWKILERKLLEYKVDIVIPSLDETLIGWADRKEYFKNKYNIDIVISDNKVIETFRDKYKTYEFFVENNIPTPKTSLHNEYKLIKPRFGRGAKGIFINENDDDIDMEGYISQEIIEGIEYTVDCLVDSDGDPIYIIPRKRLSVRDGKSVEGIVDKNLLIENYVRKILKAIKFYGPINIQCFINSDEISFIEINPRIAGGMALGFKASENWIKIISEYLINKNKYEGFVEVKNGLRMFRYYEEIFV